MVKSGVALLALAAALTGGFSYYNHFVIPAKYAAAPVPESKLTGLVGAETVAISAEIDGVLEALAVDEGDAVSTGQLLARIGRRELETRLVSQRARIAQLEARLEQSKALTRLEEERQRGQLQRADADVDAAGSEQALAVAEVQQLEAELARANQLLENRILARQEAERALMRLETARRRAQALEHRESAARSDRNTVLAGKHQLRATTLDVEQTESLIRQERAVLSVLETEQSRTEIKAPLDGVVSLRVASRGEVVRAGAPILTIVDPARTWVKVQVEETALRGVAPGVSLPVELANGERMEGEVVLVAPEGEFASQRDVDRVRRDIRTFSIKLRLPNARRTAHAGMTAYVTLPARP